MNIACTGAYPEVVKMKIDGELALVESGHTVDARQMSLAVGNEVLHAATARSRRHAGQAGICRAFVYQLTTNKEE